MDNRYGFVGNAQIQSAESLCQLGLRVEKNDKEVEEKQDGKESGKKLPHHELVPASRCTTHARLCMARYALITTPMTWKAKAPLPISTRTTRLGLYCPSLLLNLLNLWLRYRRVKRRCILSLWHSLPRPGLGHASKLDKQSELIASVPVAPVKAAPARVAGTQAQQRWVGGRMNPVDILMLPVDASAYNNQSFAKVFNLCISSAEDVHGNVLDGVVHAVEPTASFARCPRVPCCMPIQPR